MPIPRIPRLSFISEVSTLLSSERSLYLCKIDVAHYAT